MSSEQTWDEVISSVTFNPDISVAPKPPLPIATKRPSTLEIACAAYELLPREKARLLEAVPNEEVYAKLSVRSFYFLAVAARDPQADCSKVTASKKIIFYNKLNRSWESIASSVSLLGRKFNLVNVDVKAMEPVHQFRVRLLAGIYQLVK
jgi:hypothetical protein